jgi:Sec-independent protein translocase protein TatA
MEIFNIGPLELLFILVIALVVLGPKEMVNTAKKMSTVIAKVIRSPFWASMMDTTREIRDFPRKIMRETGLEENINELSKMRRRNLSDIYSIGDPLSPSKANDETNRMVDSGDGAIPGAVEIEKTAMETADVEFESSPEREGDKKEPSKDAPPPEKE